MAKDKKEQKFKWTERKRVVAKHLAEGRLKQNDIAILCECTPSRISIWKRSPEFMEKIADYILADERATKAGLVRSLLQGYETKKENTKEDKSTTLDYIKALGDMQGHSKGDTNNNILNVGVSIVDDVPKPPKKQGAD